MLTANGSTILTGIPSGYLHKNSDRFPPSTYSMINKYGSVKVLAALKPTYAKIDNKNK
jgi:hypothetical protein